ncbi:hypothetical protein O3S80_38765 [Streptomyces sp. Lzd4kr]|nr:hypothetical protein [Streptomyces sp. Lzd4kr]
MDTRRVLPTLYGDNYLWLLSGESRTLSLSWPAAPLASGRPAVRVEGHNVPAVTVGGSRSAAAPGIQNRCH